MNIYQKMLEVEKKISGVTKDTKILTYRAVSHDAVIGAIRPLLIEQGILAVPKTIEATHIQLSGEKPHHSTFVKLEVDFINVDNPEEKITVPSIGHGIDQSDKSAGKAYSYSYKNAFLKAFNLETFENDEERPVEYEQQKVAPKKPEQPKPKFTLNDKPVIPSNNRFLIKTGRYAGKSFADIPEAEIKVYLESANKMELTSREDLETRDQLNKLYGEFYGKK
jgi:hypothetical protein